MSEEELNLEEVKKDIVIERLRQAPETIKVSFGSSKEFMSRDELIKQVDNETEIGKNIVNVHIEYLRAFKKGTTLVCSLYIGTMIDTLIF